MTIDEYIEQHIDAEGEYLHELYRATQTKLLYGRMASGHVQGRFLKILTEMISPKSVLEIGTFSGYSALCIAEGLQEGGMLHTIEIFDELEDFTRPWLENSPWTDKIQFHIGDALKVVPELGIKYDMVFIDGNKRIYPDYYHLVMDYINPGGYIIADNTLWDGHVVTFDNDGDNVNHKDKQIVGVMKFNDIVAHDDRVEKVILPIRDGLSIIRVKK
ncbi:MAG: class I SAM-dependent methyltransferase [Bacteroidaceae bacterium]|nr:class I SAM-dependent methyltransferase [Bacteroidaceae bacterium]